MVSGMGVQGSRFQSDATVLSKANPKNILLMTMIVKSIDFQADFEEFIHSPRRDRI